MRDTILPKAVILSKAQVCCQYDGQGQYCGLRSASEVFLMFTKLLNYIYACLCNKNALFLTF